MRTVVVLAEAAEDIETARDFYEAQDPGIGDYFADSLLADIGSLALFLGIHFRQYGFFRMLAHRFPYGIYYRDMANETQVFAILDLRRDPNWIREELTKRIH